MSKSKNIKSRKSLFLLIGAIALACATALVARSLMRPPPPVTIIKEVAAPQVQKTFILHAASAVKPGEFVNPAQLEWREINENKTTGLQFSAEGEEMKRTIERQLSSAAFRHSIPAGAPIERTSIVYSGEAGFIAAVLTPGMRAVSIPTNAVASNAGLVSAGDWVDVILSLERDKQPATEANPATGLAAQTILHKVRVLALNNNTDSIAPTITEKHDGKNTEGANASRNAPRPYYESLTLEVSPPDAERLAVAREVGTLQVALRSVRDGEASSAPVARTGITRLNDATGVVASKTGTPAVTVKTYQGAQQNSLSF